MHTNNTYYFHLAKYAKIAMIMLMAVACMPISAQNVNVKQGEDKSQLINVFNVPKQNNIKTNIAEKDKAINDKKSKDNFNVSLETNNTASAPIISQETNGSVPAREKMVGESGTMIENMRFSNAITLINKEIAAAKKSKTSTESLERQLKMAQNGIHYLKGTDKVLVFDSIVVRKDDIIDYININPELGTYYYRDNNKENICFKTQRGNKVYTSVNDSNGIKRLTVFNNDEKGLSAPFELQGIDMDGDAAYPFVMTDGLTIYFAAKNDDGLGNYDIYVTRCNEGNNFFKPENMGYPYNSYANDYFMIIDEDNNIGMFASDRYQPEDKACIYFFIPNKSRNAYDYENDKHEDIIAAASLKSIADTQTEDRNEEIIIAKEKVKALRNNLNVSNRKKDFELVINDNTTYYSFDDFKNNDAKKLCAEWIQKKKNLTSLNEELENLRLNFSNDNDKTKYHDKIIALEKRITQLKQEVKDSEKATRNKELNSIINN